MIHILIALGLTVLLVVSAREIFGHEPGGLTVLALYFLFYLSVAWIRARRGSAADGVPGDAPPDRSEWPLSGPLAVLGRRVGGGLFFVIFIATSMFSLANPLQLRQIVRQMVGNGRLKERAKRSGHDGTEYRNRVQYRLPFDGEWMVFNGGMTPRTSHSWDVLSQRFALDFVQADEKRSRHVGKGMRLEAYHCHGKPILAAAAGEVVAVEDRISEAPLVGFGVCDFLARSFIGNHVLLRHAEGEYGLYAHLIPGSVPVKPGDRVAQGSPIGRCGHSGHSSEPHLHFHLQDAPDLFGGMGLPVEFHSLEVDGEPIAAGHLTAGERVRNV